MTARVDSTLLMLGKVGRPRGLRGGCLYWPYNDQSDALGPGVRVKVGDRWLVIDELREAGKSLEIFFETVETREQAEALTNLELAIARADLPPLDAKEFYLQDIIGLPVVDAAGHRLGSVAAVSDNGAQPLIEVLTEAAARVLVPAVPEFIVSVGERLVLSPPDGLFDDASADASADADDPNDTP